MGGGGVYEFYLALTKKIWSTWSKIFYVEKRPTFLHSEQVHIGFFTSGKRESTDFQDNK